MAGSEESKRMTDGVMDRLGELESAVKRASEALVRLRDENARLRREVDKLTEERRQSLAQIDTILKDIAKMDLG
jgi:predicted nuclease with TOPRIM domain